MGLNVGLARTGEQGKIEGLKNNERIQDTELYITRIISHRTKPDRKIICRPKKNIMTEEVMKGGMIEAQILHLKYRYPVKTEGIVPEGVIQEGVMKDETFHSKFLYPIRLVRQ